jgi:outer membrane cobalamin receptor
MKLFSGLMLSMLAVCTYAQTPSDSATVRELPAVDVLAERGIGTTSSLMPVQRLNKNQMLQLNVSSMSDALKHMAGITVRDYGGAGGMKTVSARGIGSRHTAVAYDGIALSDFQSGEIDLSRYSLENV